jgi:hypothetical protein
MGSSQDASGKPPRRLGQTGRFDPQLEQIYQACGLVGQGKTRTNHVNDLWAIKALGRLMDHGLSSFEWLYSSDRAHPMRKMVLSALGRMEDDEQMLELAREICARKPRDRDAVALIRRSRIERSPESRRTLGETVASSVLCYVAEHPEMTRREIAKTLRNLALAYEEAKV